jgi:hypothetical protein
LFENNVGADSDHRNMMNPKILIAKFQTTLAVNFDFDFTQVEKSFPGLTIKLLRILYNFGGCNLQKSCRKTSKFIQ